MASRRTLVSFGLPPIVLNKLLDADFSTVADIGSLQPSELSEATSLTIEQSVEVIKSITCENVCLESKTVASLMEEEPSPLIFTFCQSIDRILNGGIPTESITEIVGTPGIGKTQLCLQLTISVQIPREVGGLESASLYIDTEGSFSVSRLKEMALYMVDHLQSSYQLTNFTVESLLQNVHYARCHSHLELLAIIKMLPSIIAERQQIKLVIIDSIAFHIRQGIQEPSQRTSILCGLTQLLIQQAKSSKLAIVVTNQMTTRLQGNTSYLVPAMGEVWAHCPTVRLLLSWDSGIRMAKLIKAPNCSEGSAFFQVTPGGIRDFISSGSKKRKYDDLDQTASSCE